MMIRRQYTFVCIPSLHWFLPGDRQLIATLFVRSQFSLMNLMLKLFSIIVIDVKARFKPHVRHLQQNKN